jgi:hypothetical protein
VFPDKTNLVSTKIQNNRKTTEMQRTLPAVTTNAQLAILPTFSNNLKDYNIFATECLQKLLNNTQGSEMTEQKTRTHFRNAHRGELLKWYSALPLMDVDNLIWENVRTQF